MSDPSDTNLGLVPTPGSNYENLKYNPSHKKPLGSWMKTICIRTNCHGRLAYKYDTVDKRMNTISVALTGISSSAIFASTSQSANGKSSGGISLNDLISYVAGLIAVLSTILQAVHKSMAYAKLAEQHKIANKQLIKLRFRLEVIVGDNYDDDGGINFNNLTEWTQEFLDTLEAAPIIPQKIFKDEKEKISGKWEHHMAQKEKEAAKETDPLLSTAASKV
eukprot:720401_1